MSLTPNFLEFYCLAADALTVGILLYGLMLALRRTELSALVRMRIWIAIAAALLAWNGLAFFLATHGVFEARRAAFRLRHIAPARLPATIFGLFPPILFAVLVPIAIALWLILRSKTMAKIVDATPLSWLVGVQIYRAIGVLFLIVWGAGQLPWQFALPAGIGDVLVGILAIPVALAASRGSAGSIKAAYSWNVFGILDFVVALGTGFLTSPTPFQLMAFDHPNLLATRFPMVMIPAFMVPLSSIMHGICLWKLRRMTKIAV
jgi:hypothetical protein